MRSSKHIYTEDDTNIKVKGFVNKFLSNKVGIKGRLPNCDFKGFVVKMNKRNARNNTKSISKVNTGYGEFLNLSQEMGHSLTAHSSSRKV
jgi:hypothetical protein